MSNLVKYNTPLTLDEVKEYDLVQECSKEAMARIRKEAEKRGLVTYETHYVSDKVYIIDPRPAQYKEGFERIDDFFRWCDESRLICQESVSDHERRMFGHGYRHTYQTSGEQGVKVDFDWNRSTQWKGSDPKALYCYAYAYYNFYAMRPHAKLSNESAARLLQERLDFMHGANPRENAKMTVKVEKGTFGWEGKDATPQERIVVYYGDGTRGTLDYCRAYEGATIYLNENAVCFHCANGFPYSFKGEFNLPQQSLSKAG